MQTPHQPYPVHYCFYSARVRRKKWLELLSAVGSQEFGETYKLQPVSSDCLTDILDDRPPDSFLKTLSQEWDLEEKLFFETLPSHDLEPFEEISELWGRKIAQSQILIKESREYGNSLRGFLEILTTVMCGGNFLYQPLLLRRYTDKALEVELHPNHNHLVCHLESFVFKGFVEALYFGIQYKRHCFSSYCMDSYLIYDTTNQHCT